MAGYETYETILNHPRQSHHLSLQVIGELGEGPYKLPIKRSIPTAWMANGLVSAARNLSTGRNPVRLSELAINAPAALGYWPAKSSQQVAASPT
jgi:hypothetical protein